jgi:hypothetical protein
MSIISCSMETEFWNLIMLKLDLILSKTKFWNLIMLKQNLSWIYLILIFFISISNLLITKNLNNYFKIFVVVFNIQGYFEITWTIS